MVIKKVDKRKIKEVSLLEFADFKTEHKCCICGDPIFEYGFNPEPIANEENGLTCDYCFINVVEPARKEQIVITK